jgi:hypothetical protein
MFRRWIGRGESTVSGLAYSSRVKRMLMCKRALLVAAIAALLPAGLASTALADIPDGTRLPGAPVAAGAPHAADPPPFCDFPGSIFVRDEVNTRTATVTPNADGSTTTTTTGTLTQFLTHDGIRTPTFDVSGNTTEVLSADGTHLTFDGDGGNLFLIGPNGRKNTNLPAIVVTQGPVHAEVSIDPVTGVRTLLSLTGGTREDICLLLAK